jgi:SAM-dependent methyltransferase
LGDGIITPGKDYDHIWEATRSVMAKIDYRGKTVLDLGSWDGYWAFEAERRGAATVVATDARLTGYHNLLFAKEMLESQVIPICNAPVQDLTNRLNTVGLPKTFDIVQHLGLLYHLRDPLLSFAQVRQVLNPEGLVLLETAFIDDEVSSYMLFSGLEGQHHFYAISDTWAPTTLCLKETLQRSFLRPVRETDWTRSNRPQTITHGNLGQFTLGRITMLAEWMPDSEGHAIDRRKVFGQQ